jgi:hypothetical protein
MQMGNPSAIDTNRFLKKLRKNFILSPNTKLRRRAGLRRRRRLACETKVWSSDYTSALQAGPLGWSAWLGNTFTLTLQTKEQIPLVCKSCDYPRTLRPTTFQSRSIHMNDKNLPP